MTGDRLKQLALDYHRNPTPGKLRVEPSKPLGNQRELSLAYSPGVAAACEAIVEKKEEVANLTGRQNLVGVITNGSAVLGLGNIGALASKPVMEGKAVLFKKFADINVFDLELDESDPDEIVKIICSLEPTFGAINLEDIKSPECFFIEEECRKIMKIPVFHDDQHGTAIVTGAAILNWLHITKNQIRNIKIVSTGGGAAGIACLNLLISMGAKRKNIFLVDHEGLVFCGRKKDMNPHKECYAQKTKLRSLGDVIKGANIFLGLSAPGILSSNMVSTMKDQPLILALANPDPEIFPEIALEAKPDAIVATGRSDYPNQVNNVLCFPFIFRGALDVSATTINEEMKLAAVKALANLAMEESSETVANAYMGQELKFGPEYLIPKPFDPRLIEKIAPAVAKAAMDSGVAKNPIKDFTEYRDKLRSHSFRSGMLMKPVIEQAQKTPKTLVFAEGEDERILRTVQVLSDEGIAKPILVGRPEVINIRIEKLGLRIKLDTNFIITNPQSDPRYEDYWRGYHKIMERQGVSPDLSRTILRTNTTAIAAMMVRRGEADAMICGTYGHYTWHLKHILDIIGTAKNVRQVSAMATLMMGKGTFFLCDTHVTHNPTIEEIVEATLLSAKAVQNFGITPKVALLSHSNFGSRDSETALKMRKATTIIREQSPSLQIEGELQADAALDEAIRKRTFPNSQLSGSANLLIFANVEAANNAFNLLKALGDGVVIGPMLVGAAKTAHIVTPSVNSEGLINMSALAVVDANSREISPQLF